MVAFLLPTKEHLLDLTV